MIFGRRDMLADIGALRMPRVVITGETDLSRPPAEARIMAAAMGCKCIEIPAAGHIASLEAPEDVTRHLLNFLD